MSLQLQNSVNWPDRFHAMSCPPSLSQGRFASSRASHTADAVLLSPCLMLGMLVPAPSPPPPKKLCHCWAMCCSRGWCTPVLSPQLLQQCLRLLEVGRVKPLSEPAVDGREQLE